ncbi:MAG: DNA recombination protein RmuC [Pseudomonadota bacterium]
MFSLDPLSALLGLSCGTAIGSLLFYRYQKQINHELQKAAIANAQVQRIPDLEEKNSQLQDQLAGLQQEKTTLSLELQHERSNIREKVSLLEQAENKLSNAFKALSADALAVNNRSFLELAQSTLSKFQESAKTDLQSREKAIGQLLNPVNETLGQVNHKLQDLEKARVGAYEVLKHQVNDLVSSQKELRTETANLVNALRTPNVRGRWGEMQLKRVVEITGLSSHCDFIEQASISTEGNTLRPDMIVQLPGSKNIIVDAKTPLDAYLKALEAKNEQERKRHLQDHAKHVRSHILALSSKAYWEKLPTDSSPEFVVLFLPGETFFSAALESDPSLIQTGIEKKVILTTPSTLIALLHAVAYGWRQENLAENAQEIIDLGCDLYKRISSLGKHMRKLGRDLGAAIKSYNDTIGSLEQRVLPGARKFKALESQKDSPTHEEIQAIDEIPRLIRAPELADDFLNEQDKEKR